MTIEKLLKMKASDLEALSDSELEAILGPHIAHTRPEQARVVTGPKVITSHRQTQKKAQDLLGLFEKKFGLKV